MHCTVDIVYIYGASDNRLRSKLYFCSPFLVVQSWAVFARNRNNVIVRIRVCPDFIESRVCYKGSQLAEFHLPPGKTLDLPG